MTQPTINTQPIVRGFHRFTTYSRCIGTTGMYANVHNGHVVSIGIDPAFDPVVSIDGLSHPGTADDERGGIEWRRTGFAAAASAGLVLGVTALAFVARRRLLTSVS